MVIAVAYDNGEIYGHFGHCEMFALYEYGETVADCTKRLLPTEGRSGHQAMADLMREHQAAAVICGDMTLGMMTAVHGQRGQKPAAQLWHRAGGGVFRPRGYSRRPAGDRPAADRTRRRIRWGLRLRLRRQLRG